MRKWIKFQLATTYGLDKHTWNDRQQWVTDNLSTITRVAEDPIDNLGDDKITQLSLLSTGSNN